MGDCSGAGRPLDARLANMSLPPRSRKLFASRAAGDPTAAGPSLAGSYGCRACRDRRCGRRKQCLGGSATNSRNRGGWRSRPWRHARSRCDGRSGRRAGNILRGKLPRHFAQAMRWRAVAADIRECSPSNADDLSRDYGCCAPPRRTSRRPGPPRGFRVHMAEAWAGPGNRDGLAVIEEGIERSERTERTLASAELLRITGELFLLEGSPERRRTRIQFPARRSTGCAAGREPCPGARTARVFGAALAEDQHRITGGPLQLGSGYSRFTEGFETRRLTRGREAGLEQLT